MGFFNSNKEKNKYIADGIYPYSIAEITKAINMGIGKTIIEFIPIKNMYRLSNLTGDDITIQLITIDKSLTRIIIEASMIIGGGNFLGINLEANGNKQNVTAIMNHILNNVSQIQKKELLKSTKTTIEKTNSNIKEIPVKQFNRRQEIQSFHEDTYISDLHKINSFLKRGVITPEEHNLIKMRLMEIYNKIS